MKKLMLTLCTTGILLSTSIWAEDLRQTQRENERNRRTIIREHKQERQRKKQQKQAKKLRKAQIKEMESRDIANKIESIYFGLRTFVTCINILESEKIPKVLQRLGYIAFGTVIGVTGTLLFQSQMDE